MSIRFNGASRATRTTAIPSSGAAWSMWGWARVKATDSHVGAIFEILNTGVSGTQVLIGNPPGSTALAIYTGEGTYTNTSLHDFGSDTPFFVFLGQSGTTVYIKAAGVGATTWALDTTISGTSFTPNRISIGGANNANEDFDGTVAFVGVANVLLSDAQAWSQFTSYDAVIDAAAGLLSFHRMIGPDVTTDLVANVGTSANLTLNGTGTTYDSWSPISAGVSLSGGGELPYAYAVTSLVASPSAIAGATGTQTIVVVDQLGVPVPAAVVASSATAVATVTTPTTSSGQSTVTLVGQGSATITITYSDGGSSPPPATVAVSVSTGAIPPLIVTDSVPAGTVDVPYAVQLVATGTPTIVWTVLSGTLPPGISLSSSGVLSGTPADQWSDSVTIQASNGTAPAATKTFSFVVRSAGVAPVVTTAALTPATVGTTYSTTLAATGTAPITWALVDGQLPAGLTLTGSTGVIAGTPELEGTRVFSVVASNAVDDSPAVTLALTVTGGNSQWTRLPRDFEVWIRVPRDT